MADNQHSPSFFVVGAAKSGTTSLAKYLGQHPDIFMPEPSKEPAYFADHTGCSRWSDYADEFSRAESCRVVGEKSGAYLFDPLAAQRIHEFSPTAKIIIALRDRVDAAHSLYHHNRREGYETIPTFAEALAAENDRAANPEFPSTSLGYYANYLYRRRATYYSQLERYYETFPASQILIVRFADLKCDARSVCRNVFQFLGVDAMFDADVTPENIGGTMRLQFVQDWYVRKPLLRRIILTAAPRYVRQLAYRCNRRASKTAPLSSGERKTFTAFLADDIERVRQRFAVDVA